jgi:transcriptional regulator with XRE-family HTH domain
LNPIGSQQRRVPNRKLQELRLNEGLSPNDLGRRAGVSGKSVRLAEEGRTPSPRIQFAIAHALGVEVLDLWPLERQKVPR